MKRLGLFVFVLGLTAPALAGRAQSPVGATVFIKVVGKLRADVDAPWKETFERDDVEIGTGSGFVVSPYGHVLTNHHVIQGAEFHREIRGKDVTVRLVVERLEVVIPARNDGEAFGDASRQFVASVDAQDPQLDLAILSVSGPELPYLPLGDSDAASSGQPVEVIGFPFGREIELGLTRLPDIVPRASVNRGTVSALRLGEDGRPRFVQTSALLNPGNSGGPMVDAEGYAIGVVRSRLAEAAGIGFAIPINRVKDFLEEQGLLPLLPTPRLRRGGRVSFEEKGVALEMLEDLEDGAPVRTRVDTRRETSAGVHLVIDRVVSDWSLERLEESLLSGVFGDFTASGKPQWRATNDSGGLLRGNVTGRSPKGDGPLKMEYALVDLGREKLLARYLGPADTVAFNLSVLRNSLDSLQASALLTDEIGEGGASFHLGERDWAETAFPLGRAPRIVVPASWFQEAAPPFPCRDLTLPDAFLAASPRGDFTVSFRFAWWLRSAYGDVEAASACSARRGRLGDASYAYETSWFGETYRVEGVFVARGEGLLQLEAVSPLEKTPFIESTVEEWVRRNLP